MIITPEKWRPSLSMVVITMLIFILCLPITGIWLFRFYDSQLVRETEQELIVQAAFIEALMINKLEASLPSTSILGKTIPKVSLKNKGQRGNFLEAKLDLATTKVFPPRADPEKVLNTPADVFLEIGRELDPILKRSQRITLAGFRVLDPKGIIITGRDDIGQSLAHIHEVKVALNGKYESVIRQRVSKNPNPPIYTISRGTGIRVFVAMPIVYNGRLAGVAYLSRTPSHFLRELYDQRWKITLAVAFMLLITFVIAYVFIRTIKGPIQALNERTNRIAKGDRTALGPLAHHGTRELASLSEGLLSMSKKLHDRSDYINTFAAHVSHELKSPLTSIQGATELLRDASDDMNEDERNKFFNNIMGDTERLTKLLERLRELAEADNSEIKGIASLEECIKNQRLKHPDLEINLDTPKDCMINLTSENAEIIFSNLLANASQHGATKVEITTKQSSNKMFLSIVDNGDGISELNRDKIFQLFFTTKRETGGTGMGLGIIQSLLHSHGGNVVYQPTTSGSCFEIHLPLS